MLAKKDLPQKYLEWNKLYGAPFGRVFPLAKKLKRWLPSNLYWKLRGPFSIQRNNTTRAFEYPWVFEQLDNHSASKLRNLTVVDVGGGLSGFQFVLSALGCRVINVDPGMEAAGRGWPCNQAMVDKLNGVFGTHVLLHNTTMDQASIADNSIDAVISISVIEHLPWLDVEAVMQKSWRVLKPGGIFILTIDLFQDIAPFTDGESNKYGSNINVKNIVKIMPFEVVAGDSAQLFGYDEFSVDSINSNRDAFLIGGGYPAMVQCLVLKKP